VSDDELMQLCAAGDEAAFRTLVTRWEQALFALLYHLVGGVEDAEDLAQETFVRVHAQAPRYRSEGRFRSWLFRIAGNLARSSLRRRRVLRWFSFDPAQHDRQDPAATPEADLEAAERRQAVRAAIARLPFRQRQAVVLRRYQELSYREIAEILGATEAAVESLLQRAAATLRADLAGKVDLT
jgi:RNA polymerase sigma-70 factor (ECF subfamily)